MTYFNICMREFVLCFPYLNRIQDYSFVLKNISLSRGVCLAIEAVMNKVPDLVHHLCLDNNGLSGPNTQLLL